MMMAELRTRTLMCLSYLVTPDKHILLDYCGCHRCSLVRDLQKPVTPGAPLADSEREELQALRDLVKAQDQTLKGMLASFENICGRLRSALEEEIKL